MVSPELSVDKIQELPELDLEHALSLVKESALDNVEVQRAEVYRYMKGSIEMLCGIKLNSVFPEHIHSLANGLTIYKLRLLSQDRRRKYCLGVVCL